jgi:hypothetical protein
MPKQPVEQTNTSWGIYLLSGIPPKFVGIVYDQPDAEAAIKQAIKQFKVRPGDRDGLIARQRD